MAQSLRDVEKLISTDATLCVEQKKKGISGFFKSRANLLPGCKAEATKKYAAELRDAQAAENAINGQVSNAFLHELNDGGLSEQQITVLVVVVVLVLLLFVLLR